MNQVVLRVLNVELRLLLPSGACVLQPTATLSVYAWSNVREPLRLLGRVELEPARTHGLTGPHGDADRGRQRRLPRLQILAVDRIVLLDARLGDGLPSTRIRTERPAEFVVVATRSVVQHRGGVGRGTAERVWERLVLRFDGGDGVRRGEVRPLEVGRCEIRDTVSDGGGQFSDRLLDLVGVVVGLGLVRLGDPVRGVRRERVASL